MIPYDFTVIGGGIVGTATALELIQRYPDARIALIEKEKWFAVHQTGHNSGIVHAGVYSSPAALRPRFCKEGSQLPGSSANIVTRLIYPIPDPYLPFLGLHLTPMISGALTVGLNAVLGLTQTCKGCNEKDRRISDYNNNGGVY